ncbi:MAG TPA: zinc ribbon domain-containing protein [Chloroflexia bacterium]|nr:zinc ribbon domain-containing protein [Chloroflexia bacterium]
MPVYAYRCSSCGSTYERLRGIGTEDREIECPECGQGGSAKRLLSSFAAFSKTGGITRPTNTSPAGGGNSNGACGGACGCHH